MKLTKWMFACALGLLMLVGNFALAQGHGNGHGKAHSKHRDDDDQGERYYKDHDREVMLVWYDDHQNNLPPGLAKKRPAASRVGKATSAARHAPTGAPEAAATLSRRPRTAATSATS